MPPSRPVPRVLRAALVVVGLVAGVALLNTAVAAIAQEDGQDSADDDLLATGRDLFGARCALCHGEAGRGDPQGQAPPLIGVGAAAVDFYIATGRMPLSDMDEPVRHRPQRLTDEERAALVAYVPTLTPPGERGPGIPDIGDIARADVSEGLDLFIANCAACHGPTAEGIAVGQRDFSSELDVATPLEIAEAIRVGPGVMPVFGPDTLSQEEMEAVVAWVLDLRERETPGGATVGRAGPVSEGLVAWTLGMGLLVVVMYLLGQKTSDEPEADTGEGASDG